MEKWSENLLTALTNARDKSAMFACVLSAAKDLGFDHCAYGMRLPIPIPKPCVVMINNYPISWQQRYEQEGYVEVDPTVLHARRSQAALIWSDDVFAEAADLWEDARSFGLRVGWAQSTFDHHGIVGMLTLSRSGLALTESEIAANEAKMRLLVTASHQALSRVIYPKLDLGPEAPLTAREIEVLKWIADGKTSKETAVILHISIETVNWHVKNTIIKLRSANKTAAVVRAAILGLLT